MLLLLLACAPKAAPIVAEPVGPPPLVDRALFTQALEEFSQAEGWTFAPLAQLDRGESHALLVWPVLDRSGQAVEEDVVGLTIKAGGGLGASNWKPSSRRLVVELGGEDWRARDRGVGADPSELGHQAVSRARAFRVARDASDGAAAVQAAQDFSRLFALDLVIDQTVSGLLVADGALGFVSRQPQARSATFAFTLGGEEMSLEASPVPGDEARWWFTLQE